MNSSKSFKNKYGPWAIIAGASEGLGAAFAEALAKENLNLILIARRQELLKELSETLQDRFGVEVIIHSQDLADIDLLRDYLFSVTEDIGLLVYNAAFAPIGYFEDMDEGEILKTADVNIRAPLLLVKTLTGKMIPRSKGGVILMSSLSGFHGSPKIAAYSASKAYNTILAEGLWKEMKSHNIDIMACCAGAVRTPGYEHAQNIKEAPGTMNPSAVVTQALRALGKKPIVIPGVQNRFFCFILNRLLPRITSIKLMNNNTKDLS